MFFEEIDVGILGSLLGKRQPEMTYRTIDGGHPAPFPDMTDEQLYNYEVTFDVPRRTFDKPPRPARVADSQTVRNEPLKSEVHAKQEPSMTQQTAHEAKAPPQGKAADEQRIVPQAAQPERKPQLPPLDLSKPVRLVTTKQPVEIITTRARHPIYKVHAYIGDDDVVTLFTLDGRLSENGPRFLENAPQRQHLYLNIYPNPDMRGTEKFLLTQHDSKEQADAAAKEGRIACVPLQFQI